MTKKIFLTFDMDWASDEVLEDFYELLCELDVRGTINVTHNTKLLGRFREEGRLELGIHPNYNALLDGKGDGLSYKDVIGNLMEIVPEAVTVRAHSLTDSSNLAIMYAEYGLIYNLNMFYLPQRHVCVSHFIDVYGEIKIPFLFEDDLYLMRCDKDISYYLSDDFIAPRVFNFHPIHIFLNSDSIECYENAREYFKDYKELKKYCNISKFGIKDLLIKLVAYGRKKGYIFSKIKDGDWT